MTERHHGVKPFARIAGTGKAVPETVLTNADLEKIVDTSDEWITTRTGIKERRIVQRGEKTSDYCIKAARIALDEAGVKPEDLDFIIIGTISPDMRFPATAIFVQEALRATNAVAFDVSATCSGFLYTLNLGESMIALGRAKTGLCIGAEFLTPITDWADRGTCVLFGDGAGAAVLTKAEDDRGILSTYIGSGGDASHLLYCVGHGTAGFINTGKEDPSERVIHMKGNELFRFAVRAMEKSGLEALKLAGLTMADVDWVIPHQANMRIIKALGERLECPMEKIIVTIHKYGNNSSASIPLALDDARREGLIKPGQNVLAVAFGGGFTWGGSVFRF
ncbi:ketoacyl-ACP synthase III [candidate division KSB1 bacterium]|nr:MAG: ketoacyl-ACP synthase III [candidate division KSB1 bacterium]